MDLKMQKPVSREMCAWIQEWTKVAKTPFNFAWFTLVGM